MNISDPISDMLTRIRNGCKAKLPEVEMPSSKLKTSIARVLKDSGYINDFKVEGEVKKTLTIGLKYLPGKESKSVIEGLKRVSKPSCRSYAGAQNVPKALGGLGVVILSSSRGVITDRQARKDNIGGEVLCMVW